MLDEQPLNIDFFLSFQLVISFVMLLVCFVIGAICTFFVVMTAGRLQKQPIEKVSGLIATEDVSTNSIVKLKNARPSPDRRRTPLTISPYNHSDSGEDEDHNSGANGVRFVDSSNSSSQTVPSGRGQEGQEAAAEETTPLLKGNVQQRRVWSAGFQGGSTSEDTGLWYRDITGKHLIRFVVLLLLLLFSSMVVSATHTQPSMHGVSVVKVCRLVEGAKA
jgi:hypothetical protein